MKTEKVYHATQKQTNSCGVHMMDARDADCVIVAVAHKEFKALSLEDIKKLYKESSDDEKVLLDVKGLYTVQDLNNSGMRYWRL